MRAILPWLAALAPTAAAYSFPQLKVLLPRQAGEPGGPAGNSNQQPSNFSTAPAEQATFKQEQFGSPDTELVFAITVHDSSGDLSFRMGGPSMYSWVAFGIGAQMKGSLMFVMYRNGTKGSMALSARIATGNAEPTYDPKVNLTSFPPLPDDWPNGVNDTRDMYYQTGICRGCMRIAPNTVNPNSTAQPFIFAVGPKNDDYNYDTFDAPLKRHWHYGTFELDLTTAGGSFIPNLRLDPDNKEKQSKIHFDSNFAESAHVFVMVVTFVIIVPLGIFFIRSLERTTIHMVLQAIALLLVIVGFATGVTISKYYNRSKNYKSGHQIVGILVFIFILTQWIFGFVSHRRYLRTGSSIKWMTKAHKLVLGPLVFALGILNISLGLKFGLIPRLNWVYLPVIFVVIVLLALSSFYKNWFMSRWGPKNTGPSRTYINGPYGPPTSAPAPGYESGPFETRSDIALSPMGEPPAYEAKPHQPREFT